jgi:hypothetical protein
MGKDCSKFELNILRYESPVSPNEYDSNWLVIEVDVKNSEGSWKVVNPSLLTWEAEELYNWILAISKKESVEPVRDFYEPNLTFRLIESDDNTNIIRINFGAESRPPWVKKIPPWEENKSWVKIEISREDLFKAVKDLGAQLKQFPKR